MTKALLLALLAAAGCGGQLAGDDGAADEAALAAGKADAVAPAAATVVGSYQLAGDPVGAGDIVYLWLRSDGVFAWTRCYDAGCAAPVIEDGTYALSASSGRKYVTFYQGGAAGDPQKHFNAMYAYVQRGSGLALRKTRTSRWMTLGAVAEADLCTASGGRWNGSCDCGGGWPTAYSPGAGGCWTAPAVGESMCDDTQGSWSDDETNATGTFCDCGYGRVLADGGCVDR